MSTGNNRKVAIIGSGLIGRSWAMIFTSFSYQVSLYDNNKQCLEQVPEMLRRDLTKLFEEKLTRGSLGLEQRLALIKVTDSLGECLEGACHIQECVFDSLALKQDLFEQVDKLLMATDNKSVAICSSTSIHLPSLVFSKVLEHKAQCLVAHPINPPLHVRLVELIPCKETKLELVNQVRATMLEIGQKPVVLRKEVAGFALNRLQYAVFQEAFRLVADNVMSPEDVDTVVSDGLGPRYAFMGPWMTAHLNANGLADYLDRYAEGIYQVSCECQPLLRLEGEPAKQIANTMTCEVPLAELAHKRAWRDRCLVELARVKAALGDGQ